MWGSRTCNKYCHQGSGGTQITLWKKNSTISLLPVLMSSTARHLSIKRMQWVICSSSTWIRLKGPLHPLSSIYLNSGCGGRRLSRYSGCPSRCSLSRFSSQLSDKPLSKIATQTQVVRWYFELLSTAASIWSNLTLFFLWWGQRSHGAPFSSIF